MEVSLSHCESVICADPSSRTQKICRDFCSWDRQKGAIFASFPLSMVSSDIDVHLILYMSISFFWYTMYHGRECKEQIALSAKVGNHSVDSRSTQCKQNHCSTPYGRLQRNRANGDYQTMKLRRSSRENQPELLRREDRARGEDILSVVNQVEGSFSYFYADRKVRLGSQIELGYYVSERTFVEMDLVLIDMQKIVDEKDVSFWRRLNGN
jgi:hypothetical protein